MREGGQTGSTAAVRAPPGRKAGPSITLSSVLAREQRGFYGSFWALLGDRLNAPCSSSTGEPGGGSTVTPPTTRHRKRPWLAQSGPGARDTARRTAGHHHPAGTHSENRTALLERRSHNTQLPHGLRRARWLSVGSHPENLGQRRQRVLPPADLCWSICREPQRRKVTKGEVKGEGERRPRVQLQPPPQTRAPHCRARNARALLPRGPRPASLTHRRI